MEFLQKRMDDLQSVVFHTGTPILKVRHTDNISNVRQIFLEVLQIQKPILQRFQLPFLIHQEKNDSLDEVSISLLSYFSQKE